MNANRDELPDPSPDQDVRDRLADSVLAEHGDDGLMQAIAASIRAGRIIPTTDGVQLTKEGLDWLVSQLN